MKNLVKRYKQDTSGIDGKLRDQLIMDYAPLIRFVAQRIASRLPSNIEIDDLISAGVIGLIDAIKKYDPTRDNKFKTYAEFRIRGAILDELRSQDWIPRSVRDKAKKIERIYRELEQRYGRSISDDEVSKALELDVNQFHDMLSKVRSVSLLSLDEFAGPQARDKRNLLESIENLLSKNPLNHLRSKSLRQVIIESIEELPEKQKLVLSLYYFEDLNLREIGRVLDVTESRVSQLHTTAIERLKEKLEDVIVE